ncbi:NUDIX domain-containing protein [Saccharicrinis sp. FJH54]|uniref:NUDIX hydrolase n=1 Tax=Saccharicrinis sp. FJH54 TaxID=3344665 RepID=UPI0035D49556
MKLLSHISVDCVILGFDGSKLHVLLAERDILPHEDPGKLSGKYKLPGDMIGNDESPQDTAFRVLNNYTGRDRLFLKQFEVFGTPGRIKSPNDLMWLQHTTSMEIDRVITLAYLSLVKIDQSEPKDVAENLHWIPVDHLPHLIFDHDAIIKRAFEEVQRELRTDPVGFELLPKKFTIRQLQQLYEIVFERELDSRNFRKKIRNLKYIVPLEEKETGVSHKPAQLFRFDPKLFNKHKKDIGFFI